MRHITSDQPLDIDSPSEVAAARFAQWIGLVIVFGFTTVWLIPGGGAAAIVSRLGLNPPRLVTTDTADASRVSLQTTTPATVVDAKTQ